VIFLKADAEAAMENYMGLKKRKWFIPFKEEKEKAVAGKACTL
jgi:hypothetical protein